MEKLDDASAMLKDNNYVIVRGIKTDEEEFTFQVNRRGFIVEHFMKPVEPSKIGSAVLSFSSVLKVKLAVTANNNLGGGNDRSVSDAVELLTRCKGIEFEEAWLAHNPNKIHALMQADSAQSLVLMSDYFGSEIAFYMEWLKFYTGYLTIPALTGTSLFALQYFRDELDSKWNPLFNIIMCIWGSLFIESWKRRSSELSNAWDVEDAEAMMDASDIYKKKMENQKPFDRSLRFAVTVPAILAMMGAVVRIMVFFLDEISQADMKYPESYLRYYPTVAYSIVPIVTALIYEKVAVFMNDFEAYPTRIEAEGNLVLKRFLFQFVNRYCALFYTAFYLQDIEKLRSLLFSMLLMNALINNVTEIIIPFTPMLISKAKARFAGKESDAKSSPKGKKASPTSNSKGILKNTGNKSKQIAPARQGGVNFGATVTVPDVVPHAGAGHLPAPSLVGGSWASYMDDEPAVGRAAGIVLLSRLIRRPSNCVYCRRRC